MKNKLKNPLDAEYSSLTKWNPFNSFKLLTHVERWSNIKEKNNIPPPVLVTVDPTNVCNLKCYWCNADEVISKRSNTLSETALTNIANTLINWKVENYGIDAVCIAGGGEPLLNKHTGKFIDMLIDSGINAAVTTNGILMDKFFDSLVKCTWVSVSVDAGSNKTYSSLKSCDTKDFDKVISNMKHLVKKSKESHSILNNGNPYQGVCYKFLICKENIHEMYQAAQLAKSIGCRSVSFRPMGKTWIDSDLTSETDSSIFTQDDIDRITFQLNRSKELEDENFSVYSIVSRFGDNLNIENQFSSCFAVFKTAYFSPLPKEKKDSDSFILSLCCDRRGDTKLELCQKARNPEDIYKIWGSEKHWQIMKSISPSKCPRCTYKPHNEIYHNVILNDSMSRGFI